MFFLTNTFIFIILLSLHVELLLIFMSSLYLLYFINLLFALYILNYYVQKYSIIILFLYVAIVLIFVNLNIYTEFVFEIFLSFNIVDKKIYIDNEVMYALSAIHLFVFINLKRLGEFLSYNRVKNYLG